MSPETVRLLERVHAVVAWLATAALVATAAALARGERARRAAARLGGVAVVLVVCASGLGLELHDPYRARLRQRLFLATPSLGWLFERKQHVAFCAMLLSIGALAVLALLRRAEARPDPVVMRDLRRAAAIGWTAAALAAVFASVASAVVARRAPF